MTILTCFTCMVKTVTLLILNKIMQSMFLVVVLFVFFVRGNNTLTLPLCAASKAVYSIFYGFCRKRFKDISQEI